MGVVVAIVILGIILNVAFVAAGDGNHHPGAASAQLAPHKAHGAVVGRRRGGGGIEQHLRQ